MSMALRPSTVLLLFRFAAGGCGRTTGAVARSAAKGGRPRRKSGLLFVYSSHGGHRRPSAEHWPMSLVIPVMLVLVLRLYGLTRVLFASWQRRARLAAFVQPTRST